MPTALGTKHVKPHDCLFFFGIPTNSDEFRCDLRLNKGGFAAKFGAGWSRYQHEVASNIARLQQCQEDGLQIVSGLPFAEFSQLFTSRQFEVLILFSHWDREHVEFPDRFVCVAEVTRSIPEKHPFVLDLCVCHPAELRASLKKYRPNCLVRCTDTEAIPFVWLSFYYILFNQLRLTESSYLDAFSVSFKKFWRPRLREPML